MRTLPAQLDLTHLTTLRIRLDASHAFWPAVLAPMARLEELSVALGYPMEPRAEDPPAIAVLCAALAQEPLVCPALGALWIQWVGVCVGSGADDVCAMRIADMLAARARPGLGGRRLDMLTLGWTAGKDAGRELVEETVCGVLEVLGRLVGDCTCLVSADKQSFEFEAAEEWLQVDQYAEEYWRKGTGAPAEYDLTELGL